VKQMSRRTLLAGSAVAAGSVPLLSALPALASTRTKAPDSLGQQVLSLFSDLPGIVSVKFVAPPVPGGSELVISSQNASQRMFIGSAFKTFVLCEALRQADSATVVDKITSRQLALNESVWSQDSATFNPPYLSGLVSERTALEAMILHSDNTGADMCLKLVGPDNVRKFISSIGLRNTLIPNSTRSFAGYMYGAPHYLTFSWPDEVYYSKHNKPIVNPPLNDTYTMASSADDLVSYYSRAVPGSFFRCPETLQVFLETLSIDDAIWLLPVPLGVSAFLKGGSIDTPGFHALCVPGGIYCGNRWLYFCLTLNWYAKSETDPATALAFAAAGHQALTLVIDWLI
jgi:beta-lactamase class A